MARSGDWNRSDHFDIDVAACANERLALNTSTGKIIMTDQYSGEKIIGLMRDVDGVLKRRPDVPNPNNTEPDNQDLSARKPPAKAANRRGDPS